MEQRSGIGTAPKRDNELCGSSELNSNEVFFLSSKEWNIQTPTRSHVLRGCAKCIHFVSLQSLLRILARRFSNHPKKRIQNRRVRVTPVGYGVIDRRHRI